MAVGFVSQVAQPAPSHDLRPQLTPDQFEELVLSLKEALGPSSGLDSSDVDVNSLMTLLRVYDAKEKGWVPYAMADPNLAYTRNLVDEGNGKSNLVSTHSDGEAVYNTRLGTRLTVSLFAQLVLVWTPGKGSPIHDHGNAHCIMKILHGSLTESRYEFPDSDKQKPMELISQRTHNENDVAYMADELGLHKMENRGDDYAISLHCKCSP